MSEAVKNQIQADLASLESEWKADQSRYLVQRPDGAFDLPKPTNIPRCILMMVTSVIAMAVLAATPLPPYVALIGLIPFGIGTFRLMVSSSKAEAFERCKTAYESRRAALMRKLAARD
jgi:hypothetical protein